MATRLVRSDLNSVHAVVEGEAAPVSLGLVAFSAEKAEKAAKEVAEAWPDTETNEKVTFIRGVAVTRARIGVKEETIEDRYEVKGFIRCLRYCSLHILISANRRA